MIQFRDRPVRRLTAVACSVRVTLACSVTPRKLIEIANGVEAVQDGRIYIERVNAPGGGRQLR